MTVEIKVGPPVLTINRGSTFLVTDQNGEIDQNKSQGLFAEDTRFISTYQIYINERTWERVTSAPITYYAERLELTNPEVLTPDGKGTIKERTIALTIDRQITTGLEENFHIANYSESSVTFMLEIAMRSDFADIFEVKAGRLTRRGHVETRWNPQNGELTTRYQNQSFIRQVVYHVKQSSCPPSYANGRLIFEIQLDPQQTWDARCEILLLHQGRHRKVDREQRADERSDQLHDPGNGTSGDALERYQQEWVASCTELQAPNDNVRYAYRQSIEDMGALRLPEHDLGPDAWVPAAGVPWFVTLFGRDSLWASYQCMAVHAPFAEGALRELAKYQANKRDDWLDAQPGKILHELRHGELAYFHLIPFTPYYGTADSTILYLIILHETLKWTGNRKLIEELMPVAEKCLDWIDHYGDLDGDGFQEYKTFSNQGFDNMAWKDAGDAVVYRDGTIEKKQPKGTCELQGYVYDAKLRMAEIYDLLGDSGRAQALRREAAELQQRFDAKWWMEDEGCYAMGIDPDKRLIDAVTSNTGQLLWTGIVPPERAKRVVDRLFQPDMWCGWGIRTLSAKNRAYNPYSYQRGSVWPHDNGIIAAGMKRYGYADAVNKVAEGIFAAASYFDNYRLPEVFSGLERRPATFPSQYIGANIPQAWAAGSILHLIRSILGLRADAHNGVLYVNPTLPDWLSELTLKRLKVGKDTLDIHFWREGDRSRYEVIRQIGGEIDVRQEVERIPVPVTGDTGTAGTTAAKQSPPVRAHAASGGQQPAAASVSQASSQQGGEKPVSKSERDGQHPETGEGRASGSGHGQMNPLDSKASQGGQSGDGAGRPQDTADQRRAEGTAGSSAQAGGNSQDRPKDTADQLRAEGAAGGGGINQPGQRPTNSTG